MIMFSTNWTFNRKVFSSMYASLILFEIQLQETMFINIQLLAVAPKEARKIHFKCVL